MFRFRAVLALLILASATAHSIEPQQLCASLLAQTGAVGQTNVDWSWRPLVVGDDLWLLAQHMATVPFDEEDVDPLNGTDIRNFPELLVAGGSELQNALRAIESQGGNILWSTDPDAYSLFDVEFDAAGTPRVWIQLVEVERLGHELDHFAVWEARRREAAALSNDPTMLRVAAHLSDTPLGRFYDEQRAVLKDLALARPGVNPHLLVQEALEHFMYPFVEAVRIGVLAEKYLNRMAPSSERTRLLQINRDQMQLLVRRFWRQYKELAKHIVEGAFVALQAQGLKAALRDYYRWIDADPEGTDEEMPTEFTMAHLYVLYGEGLLGTFLESVELQVGEQAASAVLDVFELEEPLR